jgi:O-6-methylguanine DNA methyltransferase
MDNTKIESVVSTPWGNMKAVFDKHCLVFLEFTKEKRKIADKHSIILEAELQEYFAGKRRHFDIEFNPKGTRFEMDIWVACKKIPYGTTISYKTLSETASHPKAFRACGNALHKNPVPIIIPCHRVVASNSIGGFGLGLDLKLRLLSLENPETFSSLRQTF